VGGNGQDGDLFVKNTDGQKTIHAEGSTGDLHIGGNGQNGDIRVKNGDDREIMHFNSDAGSLQIGDAKDPVSFSLRGPDLNTESSELAFEDTGGRARGWFRFTHDT
jgi:hypothetical protein